MSMRFINENTGNIKNAVFCFTGKSPKTRPEMETMAINAGASVTKSVTKNTTILVIADATSTSSKATKARAMEIDLISPQQFFDMCNSAPASAADWQTTIQKPKPITKPTSKIKHSLVRRIQL